MYCSALAVILSFVLQLNFPAAAVQNKSIKFKSSQEVFVGENALLEWTVNKNLLHNIADVQFGVVTRPAAHGERLDAILVKKFPLGRILWNKRPSNYVASFVNRTTVLQNKTAAFVINKVKLNDSSEFYCAIKQIGSPQTKITDYVKIKVIDVQIINKTSSQDVVSWKGHTIHLRCGVRIVPHSNRPSFLWRNKAMGGTRIERSITRQRDHRTGSFIRIRTYEDEDFGPYECIAKTASTTYKHEIRIRRLYEPSAPNNFSHYRRLTEEYNCSVVARVAWMPPLIDGGASILSYIVEYKPLGQKWSNAVHRPVSTNYIDICRPERDRGGDGLRLRVKAKNKVGFGKLSPATIVTFWDEPTAPQHLRTHLIRTGVEPKIKLSWGYPRDDGGVRVSAYQIEYKPVGSHWSNAAKIETVEQKVTLWKTSKIVNIYKVRIRAINGVGFSDASTIITAAFAIAPSRPTNVVDRVLPHARPTLPHIHIHWDRPLDDGGLRITHYRLEYRTVSQKKWHLARHALIKDENYIISRVQIGEEYVVRVAAKNPMGYGAYSSPVTVRYREKAFVVFKARSRGGRQGENQELYFSSLLFTVVLLALTPLA